MRYVNYGQMSPMPIGCRKLIFKTKYDQHETPSTTNAEAMKIFNLTTNHGF